jgi:hypothetical protein
LAFGDCAHASVGVTATLGFRTRTFASHGLNPDRLEGLTVYRLRHAAVPGGTWLAQCRHCCWLVCQWRCLWSVAASGQPMKWPRSVDANAASGWCAAGISAMTGLAAQCRNCCSSGMAGALSGWVFRQRCCLRCNILQSKKRLQGPGGKPRLARVYGPDVLVNPCEFKFSKRDVSPDRGGTARRRWFMRHARWVTDRIVPEHQTAMPDA